MWSQTGTTAAWRCTMPCFDSSRQVHTSMSRWALVLLRHNRCFQVFRPAIPRKTSHFSFNSLITNLSSGGTWCNDLAFWTPFSVGMMCSPVIGRLANPDFNGSISDPNCLLVRMCACASITLSPNGNTWIVYAFPKTRANTILSSFLTVTLVKHHAACRINHAIEMLSLGNFLTKDYQMTTTSHHSVRIFNLALTLMAGSRTMSQQCSFDSSVLYNLQQLFQHKLLV